MEAEATAAATEGLNLFSGLGITAIGFVFLWLVMKQYFKLAEKNTGSVNMLADVMSKLNAMQDSIRDGQAVIAEIYKHLDSEVAKLHALYESQNEFRATSTEVYRHLDAELTKQTGLLNAISGGFDRLINEIHFVNKAVDKGYMTAEQGRDIVAPDKK